MDGQSMLQTELEILLEESDSNTWRFRVHNCTGTAKRELRKNSECWRSISPLLSCVWRKLVTVTMQLYLLIS